MQLQHGCRLDLPRLTATRYLAGWLEAFFLDVPTAIPPASASSAPLEQHRRPRQPNCNPVDTTASQDPSPAHCPPVPTGIARAATNSPGSCNRLLSATLHPRPRTLARRQVDERHPSIDTPLRRVLGRALIYRLQPCS